MSDHEKLLPLAAAVEAASGQRPNPSTIHRWRLRGIAGQRLETVRLGGKRLASVEAVRRFMNAVTASTDGSPAEPRSRTNRQREAAIARAERELDRAGI